MTDQEYAEIFRKLENSYNSLLEKTGEQLKEMLSSFDFYEKLAGVDGLSVWKNEGHVNPRLESPFYTLRVTLSRTTKLL